MEIIRVMSPPRGAWAIITYSTGEQAQSDFCSYMQTISAPDRGKTGLKAMQESDGDYGLRFLPPFLHSQLPKIFCTHASSTDGAT